MNTRNEGGFTLIETILGLVVMMIMVTAITGLFVSNLQTVTLGKARAIALSLANEQMEYLRDLPYQSVATQAGAIYPPGNIPDTQTVVRGDYTFTLKTEVSYVDDPYDGYISCPCASGPAAGKPKDLNPADYKKSQVSVYLKSSGKLVGQLTSDVAAKAAETASNTGVLSVLVKDANDSPIANANVHIVNATPTPDVDITTTTDSQGYVVIPNLPPDSNNGYQITASLSGYSTDSTIPDPAGTQTAVQLNPNILVQQVTQQVLRIDRISTMAIHAVDTSGNPLSGLSVTTTGSKNIKLNPTVAKYAVATSTNATGDIALSSMEWDSYSFSVPAGNYIVSAQPYAPVAVAANSAAAITLVVSTSSTFPRITKVAPVNGQAGTSVAFTITGVNLPTGSTVKLKQSGQTDITASSVASSGGNTKLTGNFDLTGAVSGAWDVVVTTGVGTVTQTGGFSVTP